MHLKITWSQWVCLLTLHEAHFNEFYTANSKIFGSEGSARKYLNFYFKKRPKYRNSTKGRIHLCEWREQPQGEPLHNSAKRRTAENTIRCETPRGDPGEDVAEEKAAFAREHLRTLPALCLRNLPLVVIRRLWVDEKKKSLTPAGGDGVRWSVRAANCAVGHEQGLCHSCVRATSQVLHKENLIYTCSCSEAHPDISSPPPLPWVGFCTATQNQKVLVLLWRPCAHPEKSPSWKCSHWRT